MTRNDPSRDADDIERGLADLDFLVRRHFARLGLGDGAEQASVLIDQLGDLVLSSRSARARKRPLHEVPVPASTVCVGERVPVLVPARLVAAREKAGLNVESLATRAKCSEKVVRRIEDGTYNPALRMVAKLAVACGVEINSLYQDLPQI